MPRPYALRSAAAALVFLCACGAAPQKPPNVLFIAVDDLRPQTGAYGESGMVTPNFDRFAAQARLFERHYVQVPTCGASRYALLTGNRPASAAHTRNDAIRDLLPKTERETPESFAHLFRRAGYRTVSIGKISHYVDGRIYSYEGEGEGAFEMPFSWDRRIMPYEKWGTAWNAFFGYADGSNRNMERGAYPPFENADVPDTAYPDGLIAEEAVAQLRELQDEPFLLAVGFFKPHLPFTAPAKYWDLTTARRSTFRRTRRRRQTSTLRACTAAERCSATTSMTKRAASAFACRTLTPACCGMHTMPRCLSSMRKSARFWTSWTGWALPRTRLSSSGATTAGTWGITRFGASTRLSNGRCAAS